MSKMNSLLTERLKKGSHSSKMATLAQQSANGQLTSFAGVFGAVELSSLEHSFLESLLANHSIDGKTSAFDLQHLISITAEVKAINNQAIMLHGERIKKAHTILTRYKDGAFTAWLIAAYGNRQTPYNFLQYYDFHEAIPKLLRVKLETMPRQAAYALASRDGNLEKKQRIIEDYQGETKTELLKTIRETFPLDKQDKRREDVGENMISALQRLCQTLRQSKDSIANPQKKEILRLLAALHDQIV